MIIRCVHTAQGSNCQLIMTVCVHRTHDLWSLLLRFRSHNVEHYACSLPALSKANLLLPKVSWLQCWQYACSITTLLSGTASYIFSQQSLWCLVGLTVRMLCTVAGYGGGVWVSMRPTERPFTRTEKAKKDRGYGWSVWYWFGPARRRRLWRGDWRGSKY